MSDPAEMIKAALAEAGYPAATTLFTNGDQTAVAVDPRVPFYVQWKAAAVTGHAVCCWPCRRALGTGAGWLVRIPCGHDIDPFCPEDASDA